jgi:hypothetical protein
MILESEEETAPFWISPNWVVRIPLSRCKSAENTSSRRWITMSVDCWEVQDPRKFAAPNPFALLE